MRLHARSDQQVRRALDATPSAIEDVGIDHGRLETGMTEQLLQRPDIVARLEERRREGVTKTAAGRGLHQTRLPGRILERALDAVAAQSLVETRKPDLAGYGLAARGRARQLSTERRQALRGSSSTGHMQTLAPGNGATRARIVPAASALLPGSIVLEACERTTAGTARTLA